MVLQISANDTAPGSGVPIDLSPCDFARPSVAASAAVSWAASSATPAECPHASRRRWPSAMRRERSSNVLLQLLKS